MQSLRKSVDYYKQKLDSITDVNSQQFDRLKGLPFYDWSVPRDLNWESSLETGRYSGGKIADTSIYQSLKTDFNHAIGLPQKNGQSYPLFDYEQLLFDTLQSNKHVWIKKATGLGVTEFMLRYMAWLCLSIELTKGSQMCIVTGPRIELAITLIDRMKRLFITKETMKSLQFTTKETVIELNGVHIEAYPSHHLDAMRGLTNVSFIYLDEADFFPPGQQQDARDVSERYIGKSNPWIVMVSTPNAPEGLFERIEQEPESSCLYKRLFLDYTYGLDRIYCEAEITAAKASPSFEREYNLKYLGLIGNVFHTRDIEAAIEKGRIGPTDSPNLYYYTQKSVGLDPGFGSSNFGVCITELVDGLIHVIHASEHHRPSFNQMIDITIDLLDKYNITFEGRSRIFVDGANPSFIRALKERLDEDTNYEHITAYLKKQYSSIYDLKFLEENMFVIPVAFSKEHKKMLAHTKAMLEYHNGQVAINPRYTKLITSLRTAVENGEGILDKEATSHDDLFDAFRLTLQFWH